MTLNEILQSLPAEIGRYTLAITRYLDPELEQLMWSMTYECSADGTILPGCDINEQDFEDGARKLYDLLQGHGYITESDNNALAHLMGDPVAEVDNLIERGYRIDFNQALDARLVTDELARLLAQVKWIDRRIRFGCDTQHQIGECERAMALINGHGYKGEYFLYTMLNDDFAECYTRIHYWWKRNQEQREKHLQNIYPFAQPYRDPGNPHRPIPQWQKDMAGWCNKHQLFQVTDFGDFTPRRGFRCSEYLNNNPVG